MPLILYYRRGIGDRPRPSSGPATVRSDTVLEVFRKSNDSSMSRERGVDGLQAARATLTQPGRSFYFNVIY